ncbi:hypothetical protein GUITHDRAFT_152981 [Guillardia theta CCMP2712]|uniref:Hyaluronan/mRNA-binding protein domain-containing protein n=1 Tax=Guillardia theta (strain CCMP2712) TaxID=905079 RepID=L1J844_GUITC|nr:hypothetical protein GUITHDRAFT_152981 [Guillardia theta CCMP2712]EKX44507.1 hypothetical protein GUITHDRAFT_152981 [Guillardia theta CCMP2712]|eukprot:XP_005831487.1 hypothetical protein GUITHDRAFT_152981 [Guillardia theta CCMP2712]
MTRSKQFTGNRPTRKNCCCDRRDGFGGQIFTKTFAKKHGSGKGNWGRPGDEMYNLPMSVKDPSFDPTEDAMDQALYDHMKSGVEWSPDGSPRLSYSSSELEIDGFDFFDEDSS